MSAASCHACGSSQLRVFYEQKALPVHSCLMLDSREAARAFPRGDLRLELCEACGFIQNALFDASVHDYGVEYEETQEFSPRFRAFQTQLCRDQARKYDLAGKTALEIGCGKGSFLVELCEIAGAKGIGIDPSYRPERRTESTAARVRFIQDFYSEKHGELRADYVCCRHTLEHIPNVQDFVSIVRRSLDERARTPVFFEIPDTERILVEQAFEDIYYEHCSYFTLGSLARLFRRCGFEVVDLYKGFGDQYLMIEARPVAPGAGSTTPLPNEEDVARTSEWVARFQTEIDRKLGDLRKQLRGWEEAGKRIALWGSGSKAVAYLAAMPESEAIRWIVDINPHKHGKFLAGSGYRIDAPDALIEGRPDVVLIMNAIYTEEIRSDLARRGLFPELTAL